MDAPRPPATGSHRYSADEQSSAKPGDIIQFAKQGTLLTAPTAARQRHGKFPTTGAQTSSRTNIEQTALSSHILNRTASKHDFRVLLEGDDYMKRSTEVLVGICTATFGLLTGYSTEADAKFQRIHASACAANGTPPGFVFNPYGFNNASGTTGSLLCPFVDNDAFLKGQVNHVFVDMHAATVSGYSYASIETFDGTAGSNSLFEYVTHTGWNSLSPDVTTIWRMPAGYDYPSVTTILANGNFVTGVLYNDNP